ncbi:MAG: AI-2E family transporter [Proteobacteria bacterium]|nr:AI-2E family transporter [Pseudomonadota bacterium]
MDWSVRAAIWLIAVGVIAAVLYLLRDALTPFALALILWLAIDSLAAQLDKRIPYTPRWLALPIALVLVLGMVTLTGWVVAANLGGLAANFPLYETRLDRLIAELYVSLRLPGHPPTLANLIARMDPAAAAAQVAAGLQGLASYVAFILIYLAFLFPAAAMMPRKFNAMLGHGEARIAAREVMGRIHKSMERYLWVQTVVSLMITGLTYVTLMALGLQNALFWAFLIFFLNFIPTIGPTIAVVLVTLVAAVQFPTFEQIATVLVGVAIWPFLIGNLVLPRMASDSLNLSAVVMLLALSIWSAIWGLTGAFLAAPLTVMLMIVLAQFHSTRWIAILLSADGKPTPHSTDLSKSESGSN